MIITMLYYKEAKYQNQVMFFETVMEKEQILRFAPERIFINGKILLGEHHFYCLPFILSFL